MTKNKAGYKTRYGQREHRCVMETMIGRPLTDEEVVHHRNNKPSDNRPENLLLFSNNAEHMEFHSIMDAISCRKGNPSKYKIGRPATGRSKLFISVSQKHKLRKVIGSNKNFHNVGDLAAHLGLTYAQVANSLNRFPCTEEVYSAITKFLAEQAVKP